ncbi:MAG: hypothetical protein JSR41_07670 [Proteobacteria bacterium]|nr:hypothetical protein [Pseudomonadota bacterium]
MTEVSTRPRKGATTVAKTATPVTSSATPVAAPAPVEDHAAEIAYAEVAELLDQAAAEEGPEVYSGESERLLRMGATLARKFVIGDRDHEESAENFAYDIAALVRASRLVPGDGESKKRAELLEQCEPILRSLVDDKSESMFKPLAARPRLDNHWAPPTMAAKVVGEMRQHVRNAEECQALARIAMTEICEAISNAKGLASGMEPGSDQHALVLHAVALLEALPLRALNVGTTQEDAEAVYEGMLLPLAVLRGAVACDAQTNGALAAVVRQADIANSSLDSVLMQHLPHAESEDAPPTPDENAIAAAENVQCLLQQVEALLDQESYSSDAFYGCRRLVQQDKEQADALMVDAHTPPTRDAMSDLTCSMGVSLAVLKKVNDDTTGNLVLHSAETLLGLAIDRLDAAVSAMPC